MATLRLIDDSAVAVVVVVTQVGPLQFSFVFHHLLFHLSANQPTTRVLPPPSLFVLMMCVSCVSL